MLMYLMIVAGLAVSASIGVPIARANPFATVGMAVTLVAFGWLYAMLLPKLIPHAAFGVPWAIEIFVGAVTLAVGLFLSLILVTRTTLIPFAITQHRPQSPSALGKVD